MLTNKILSRGGDPVKGMITALAMICAVSLLAGCSGGGNTPENTPALMDEGDQPTPIQFEGQSTPVLLPHTNLYIFLTSSRPLYYRDGAYYQFYQDYWYRSEDLKGPWMKIDVTQIPDLLRSVPPEYYYDNFPYKLRKDQ